MAKEDVNFWVNEDVTHSFKKDVTHGFKEDMSHMLSVSHRPSFGQQFREIPPIELGRR
jgi:hypothetical protein